LIDFTPFWLSFKLATITTALLFLIALPYAWWLYRSRSSYKPIFEAVTALRDVFLRFGLSHGLRKLLSESICSKVEGVSNKNIGI